MLNLKKLALLFMLTPVLVAQTATEKLTGNIQIPNASTFNGYLSIKLNGANLKNICTTPFVAVPTMTATYPIVNGVANISSANFISQDCLSPRVPYYIEIADSNNIIQSTDNWYIPRTITGTSNIGDMQEVHFTGPINVAVPQAIVSNPAVAQNITQAPGTSLNINTSSGGKAYYNGVELNTIDITTLALAQLSINGASTAYPLNVNGLINASSGYLAGGSGGIIGQCLVSNGSSFVPGTCSAAFPTLYYQLMLQNSSALPQRQGLDHTSAFHVTDESSSETLVDLATVGTPNTYANIASITTNQYGQVTNVTTGGTSTFTRACNSNGCAIQYPDGTLEEWGVSTAVPTGADANTIVVAFPQAFTTTTNLSFVAWADNCSQSPCGTSAKNPLTVTGNGSLSTTSVNVVFVGVVPTGGGGTSLNTTIHAHWHAWGY